MVDARRYTWAPFGPGNQVARRHGVWAADRAHQVAAEVETIAARVAKQFPWTTLYGDERRAYARALVDERDVRDYLDRVGVLDEDHVERPAVKAAERFAARAARCRASLGLTPVAHARLLAAVGEVVRQHGDPGPLDSALVGLLAEGRRALERGSTALVSEEDDS